MSHKTKVDNISVEVFTWDWKEQPCVQTIADSAVYMTKVNGGCFAYQPETNADEYCCVLSPVRLDEKQASAAYENRYDFED